MRTIDRQTRLHLRLTGLALACFLALGTRVHAQHKVWIIFGDKGPEAPALLADPAAYLSSKAIARQADVQHAPTLADVPVSATYRQALAAAGIELHATSRWLNAVSATTDLSLAQLQAICPAVIDTRPVGQFVTTAYPDDVPALKVTDNFDYGQAQNQIHLMNLDCLHQRGYTGRDVLLAIFDSGFQRMDTISAFDSLWLQNRVLIAYDFVNHDNTVFDEHNHGMNVASTIVAHLPGQMVGAAPHVTLALARTENVASETHQEEDNWLQAVEWADSLGADVIQSSLGYTTFDPGEGDFTYASLDGNTTIVTRAADMAAARGIIVVNSAGNEGGNQWHHISAPCDADSILCVGGTDDGGFYVGFSGVGPSFDGRVKPDVAAKGLGVAAINGNGQVGATSGTSFSAPLISGLVACLRQAHPLRTNMDIVQAIRQSGSQFNAPDTLLGYGVPDACWADSVLHVQDSLELASLEAQAGQGLRVYPNPAGATMLVELPHPGDRVTNVEVVSVQGGVVLRGAPVRMASNSTAQVTLTELPAATYFLRVTLRDGKTYVSRFVKE